MPYGDSALRARAQAGDPGLFGSIGKFLGGAAKFVGGVVPGPIGGIIGGVGGILAPGKRRRIPGPLITPSLPGAGIISPRPFPTARGRAIPGVAFPEPRRRRMDPGNTKALRRAVRRVSAWDRQRKSVEKSLRKIAPPARRRARADIPPGHRHVR